MFKRRTQYGTQADQDNYSEDSWMNDADLEDNNPSDDFSSDWDDNFEKEECIQLLNNSFEDLGEY